MPGDSLVTFELFEEEGKTRVRLTHTGVESFATDNPDFRRESFVGGWNEIIGKLLKEYAEKNRQGLKFRSWLIKMPYG